MPLLLLCFEQRIQTKWFHPGFEYEYRVGQPPQSLLLQRVGSLDGQRWDKEELNNWYQLRMDMFVWCLLHWKDEDKIIQQ